MKDSLKVRNSDSSSRAFKILVTENKILMQKFIAVPLAFSFLALLPWELNFHNTL